MPFSFILALILIPVGILSVALAPLIIDPSEANARQDRHRLRLWLTVGFGALTLLLLFTASATIVPARSVGVVVSFGRPSGQLDNGFHMVAPWARVEKFDAGIQTLVMQGEHGEGADAPCVTVRLGNQTTACVDVRRAQWNIDPHGDVVELYRRYRKFDRIEHAVVQGQIMNSLSEVFATFDPLAGISGSQDAPAKTTDDLASEALRKAQSAIGQSVGSGIHLDTLLIFVHYDPVTQSKLNSYAQALADTRIATQQRQTADQQALANKALAQQAAVRDPGVQYQNCLNLIKELATKDQLGKLPATFNCGDPRSQVIVNGGTR